jgi:hypothetical protein
VYGADVPSSGLSATFSCEEARKKAQNKDQNKAFSRFF